MIEEEYLTHIKVDKSNELKNINNKETNLKLVSNNNQNYHENKNKKKLNKYERLDFKSKIVMIVIQNNNNLGISLLHSENIISSLSIDRKNFEEFCFQIFQQFKPSEIYYQLQDEKILEFLNIIYAQGNKEAEKLIKRLNNFKFSYKNLNLCMKNYFSLIFLEESPTQINMKVNSILENLAFEAHLSLWSLLSICLYFFIENRDSIILEFNLLSFNDYTKMSANLLRDLSIFEERMHPSLVKGFGKSKEGVSLFSLFLRNCTTCQGKKVLKQIFSYPLKNRKIIELRLNSIEKFYEVYRKVGISFSKQIKMYLRKISDISKIIVELKRFKLNNTFSWILLKKSLFASLDLLKLYKANFIKNNIENYLDEILNKINLDNIINILKFLDCCITDESGMICLKEGLNEELDYIREDYCKLNEIMNLFIL